MMAIENLDKALSLLAKSQKTYYSHATLKAECFDNSSEIDVEAIINKLDKDGFLHFGSGVLTNGSFKISFDGELFEKEGGYQGAIVRATAKEARLEKLERNQRTNQSALTWLTLIIAFGTIVAAVYYGIEIYKYISAKS